jgi:hypothetical protein
MASSRSTKKNFISPAGKLQGLVTSRIISWFCRIDMGRVLSLAFEKPLPLLECDEKLFCQTAKFLITSRSSYSCGFCSSSNTLLANGTALRATIDNTDTEKGMHSQMSKPVGGIP